MNKAELQKLVEDHFADFSERIAREAGTSPLAALIVIEWADSNGSVAFQSQPHIQKPVLLRILDGLGQRTGVAIQRLKRMVNTHQVPGVTSEKKS